MKLPIKISPDHIKQSIVEIKYDSELPFEILVGYIFSALDDSFKYTSFPQQISGSLPKELSLNFGVQNVFYTDKIRLQIQPQSLIFNCIDSYLGWQEYTKEIFIALEQILKIKEIQKFTRVGIRYISEYENIGLQDFTKFDFTFGIPEIKSETFIFRTEFNWGNLRVVLNLQHLIPTVSKGKPDTDQEIKSISNIDIDVISDGLEIATLSDLIQTIELTHTKEKEVFFNLLDQGYLESVNPVYN